MKILCILILIKYLFLKNTASPLWAKRGYKKFNICVNKYLLHANFGVWEQTQIEKSNLSGLSMSFKQRKLKVPC